jgi:hypothetical protein
MTLIDWLRRLGILRFGSESGVYHNAKERPTSFQMDGVFNSEKDVINLDNRPAPPNQPAADSQAKRNP